MSFIPGDEYHQDEPFFTEEECRCELCGEVCELEGDDNYCRVCQEREDQLEATMPITHIEPLRQRPVEGPTFGEWKRIVTKLVRSS